MSRRSSFERIKGRRLSGGFLALPRAVLDSPQWAALTANEIKLLIDVAAGLRGRNNGDLSATWSLLKSRGWKSKGTYERALRGLLQAGFLIRTRQGGRRDCSLFAVTWLGIDECDGKIDVRPNAVPSNAWRGGS